MVRFDTFEKSEIFRAYHIEQVSILSRTSRILRSYSIHISLKICVEYVYIHNLYFCTYKLLNTYTYSYIHMYIHTCMDACTYIHIYMCTYVCVYMYMYACTYMYICFIYREKSMCICAHLPLPIYKF